MGSGFLEGGDLGPIMLIDPGPLSSISKDRDIISPPGPDSKTGLIEFSPMKHISLVK